MMHRSNASLPLLSIVSALSLGAGLLGCSSGNGGANSTASQGSGGAAQSGAGGSSDGGSTGTTGNPGSGGANGSGGGANGSGGSANGSGGSSATVGGAGGAGGSTTSASSTGGGDSGAVFWMYHDGVMSPSWPYDFSFGDLVLDYKDASGDPRSDPFDIKATGPLYAGWQPASLNYSFDVTAYHYLTFALKPTVAHQEWQSEFHYVNDVSTNVLVDLTGGNYGPSDPTVGSWNVYKIPLADFFPNGNVPATIYKFFIQDQTGNGHANNTWYIDDVAFTAN